MMAEPPVRLLTAPVLSRQPPGFLDFFGIKSGGRNPQQISETIVPTIEMLRIYEIDSEEIAQTTAVAAGGALGDFDFNASVPNLAIPSNEFWHVHEYSLILGIAAATLQVQVWPTIQIRNTVGAGGNVAFIVGDPFVSNTAAAALATQGRCRAAKDFWAPAGSLLGGYTGQLNPLVTAISAFAQLRFTRYRRL